MYTPAILLLGLAQGLVAGPDDFASKEKEADDSRLNTHFEVTIYKPWYEGVGLQVELVTMVGTGTFITNENSDNPYWASTLLLNPYYSFNDDMMAGFSFWLTYEWTSFVNGCGTQDGPRAPGAPIGDCSDSDDINGRRIDQSDLDLWFEHSSLVNIWDARVAGWASVSFPTSRWSQAANNALTTSFGARINRSFGGIWHPSLSMDFAKFFPTQEAPSLDQAFLLASAVPIANCRPGQVNCVALSGFVPDYRLGIGLDMEFTVPPVPGLAFTIGAGYTYTRRYGRPPDEFTPFVTDSNGDRVVTGINDADQTFGRVQVRYTFLENWTAKLGFTSQQPARTADGQSIRFPFYDFISPANNFTAWYVAGEYNL